MKSLQNTQETLNQAFREIHVATYGTGDHTLTRNMTAIHEAGHAVIYRLIGIKPSVEIYEDDEGYWTGFCGLHSDKLSVRENILEHMAAGIITSMSGYTAEKNLTKNYCPSSSGDDKAKAQATAILLGKFTSTSPELILSACQAVTDSFINQHTDSVLSLADKLMEQNYINPDTTSKILKVRPKFDGLVGLGRHVLEDHIHIRNLVA